MSKSIQVKKKRKASSLAAGLGGLLGSAAGAAGGWILYSNMIIDHQLPLAPAIPAEQNSFNSLVAGKVNYYLDRQVDGRPLVLIHSVNAAASAYEMRPLFQHYRLRRPVFAIDLPGYGFSSRSPREYTSLTFATAIMELLDQTGEQPADLVALSLGCEFSAWAALQQPERVRSLTLISPSGFNLQGTGRASQKAGQAGDSGSDTAYQLLSFPLWSRPLFDLIVTRRSIQYFLQQSFVGPVDQGLADYGYATSHQPGAENVPLYFLSGRLFTRNIADRVYAKLAVPSLVLYDRDAFVRFDRLPELVSRNANFQTRRITPTLGLPHFEKLPETIQVLDQFWTSLD